jgi:23S rRNA (adenine2503-C2)-methyltransferase
MMDTTAKISPLALTAVEFAASIQQRLGKGYQHALALYTSWMRTGELQRELPIFNHSPHLFDEIVVLCDFTLLPVVHHQREGDTTKFLLRTEKNLEIESVLIPMKSGNTLCVSSQIGCRMGCVFCETGRMGLLRNLTPAEIVGQLFAARHLLKLPVKNIVFMGMGEPFDNYDAVWRAFQVLTEPWGCGFGQRQITVSTSGHLEGIHRLMAETQPSPNLAVSISAATDELRNKLMPVNRKWPLADLHAAIREYNHSAKRGILVAYVMLEGVNDSEEHADQLADFLSGLQVKINIIPYNAQKRDRFAASAAEVIDRFARRLRDRGYYTLLRQTKGSGIMAACGQLGNVEQRKLLRFNRPEGKRT